MPPVSGADIVTAARKYLGKPLRHQGRFKALDCVGLVLAIADDLRLVDIHGQPIKRADYANYGPQPVDGAVQEEISQRLLEVPSPAASSPAALNALSLLLQPGDVVTLRVPLIPCHVGVVSTVAGKPGVIHAYSSSKKVVEHRFDANWLRRIAGVFRFPGVTANG